MIHDCAILRREFSDNGRDAQEGLPTNALALPHCADGSRRTVWRFRTVRIASRRNFGPSAPSGSLPDGILGRPRCADRFPTALWGFRAVRIAPRRRFGVSAPSGSLPDERFGGWGWPLLSDFYVQREGVLERGIPLLHSGVFFHANLKESLLEEEEVVPVIHGIDRGGLLLAQVDLDDVLFQLLLVEIADRVFEEGLHAVQQGGDVLDLQVIIEIPEIGLNKRQDRAVGRLQELLVVHVEVDQLVGQGILVEQEHFGLAGDAGEPLVAVGDRFGLLVSQVGLEITLYGADLQLDVVAVQDLEQEIDPPYDVVPAQTLAQLDEFWGDLFAHGPFVLWRPEAIGLRPRVRYQLDYNVMVSFNGRFLDEPPAMMTKSPGSSSHLPSP